MNCSKEKKKEKKKNKQEKECIKSEQKEKIQEMGLNAIQDYFQLSNDEMASISSDILHHIHNKAKLGMQFEKEMGLSKRAIEMNYIRIFRLVAEDKKELKKLIKESLPQYYS